MLKRVTLPLATSLFALATAPTLAQMAADEVTGTVGTETAVNQTTIQAEIVPLTGWQTERPYEGGWSVDDLLGADVYTPGSAMDQATSRMCSLTRTATFFRSWPKWAGCSSLAMCTSTSPGTRSIMIRPRIA